jgi:Methyltransferase domain.
LSASETLTAARRSDREVFESAQETEPSIWLKGNLLSYADITTNDRNPIKRWLQNRRLDDALVPLRHHDAQSSASALDFGGGDAELSRRFLERFPQGSAACYEPSDKIRTEATAVGASTRVQVVSDLAELAGRRFEIVTCCEVFEHLPPEQTALALEQIRSLLTASGVLVIGVPNEIYLVGLLKGLFRMTRRFGAYDARWDTVISSALGRPKANRPVLDIEGMPFIYPHTGFDFRALKRKVREAGYQVTDTYGSPFRMGPSFINSEVYLVLKDGGRN